MSGEIKKEFIPAEDIYIGQLGEAGLGMTSGSTQAGSTKEIIGRYKGFVYVKTATAGGAYRQDENLDRVLGPDYDIWTARLEGRLEVGEVHKEFGLEGIYTKVGVDFERTINEQR